MKVRDFLQLAFFVAAVCAVTPWLGGYLARVFREGAGAPSRLRRFFAPLENAAYRLSGIVPTQEMAWPEYLLALLAFNGLGILLLMLIQLLQRWLPLNPAGLPGVPFGLALSTAISFVTNTNWQAYSGENTMSSFTQMAGLAVQNFLSAATGLAVAMALMRGLARRASGTIGNFWADLTRGTCYVLLPLSVLFALFLVSQGVVQTFAPNAAATTLEGAAQAIPLGPVASQIAIKQLGTNGGGFFGVNAAHPFEDPNALANFLQMLAMFALPAALTFAFGRMVRDQRQGWVLFLVMLGLFLAGLAVAWGAEASRNPALGLASAMEGKETRFGIFNSVLFGTVTTDTSCGAVIAMHDSLSPLGGLVFLANMMVGEVIFGGVGSGFYGIVVSAILTVFLAGLMVGRTPEYLGKKIEAPEIRWAVVAALAPCGTILLGAAIACWFPLAGLSGLNNAGPHGLSEVLYAFTSATANNGSAFGGLNANTDFYNYMLAGAMLIGRFAVIAPVLAIAGSLAAKNVVAPSAGTFPTHGATFGVLLVCVILIVGVLTFLPVLSLGPLAEHLLLLRGQTFAS